MSDQELEIGPDDEVVEGEVVDYPVLCCGICGRSFIDNPGDDCTPAHQKLAVQVNLAPHLHAYACGAVIAHGELNIELTKRTVERDGQAAQVAQLKHVIVTQANQIERYLDFGSSSLMLRDIIDALMKAAS